MDKEKAEFYQTEIHNIVSEIDNSDLIIPVLQKAVDSFCSNWDICEGLKYALLETVNDQLQNHYLEQDVKDYEELIKVLTE